jgi:hypothetical protein
MVYPLKGLDLNRKRLIDEQNKLIFKLNRL